LSKHGAHAPRYHPAATSATSPRTSPAHAGLGAALYRRMQVTLCPIMIAPMPQPDSLLISYLRDSYRTGRLTPASVMEALLEQSTEDAHHVWITRFARDQVMAYVTALEGHSPESLPLYGIPFVIKDNIDLAGVATTAACPSFAYTPTRSATVVQKLIDAGAIPLGKTNLDQFATGLVGTRSPYGACRNSFNPDYISGGSSSGSAVAVALGLASFSLGTDTAGSGRVPAGFNNLIGLKPSNGRLSTRGVVPACRSLDCVSIFSLTAEDAAAVLNVAEGYDAEDPYSRGMGHQSLAGLRFGVPRRDQLEFFGDTDYRQLFDDAVRTLQSLGGTAVDIDLQPFLEAARLLYDGPWLAERYAAVGAFIEAHGEDIHPVTRKIIEGGKGLTAVAAFQGEYRLRELKRRSEAVWPRVDIILTPTSATIYRQAELDADPIRLNANLGLYTNFMNLFDLAGVSVPVGFRGDGMPCGVTLVGPRASDQALLALAGRLQRASVNRVGALRIPLPAAEQPAVAELRPGHLAVAVCGAHLQGLPLNHQLRDRGGYLLQATSSAPRYRLFALPGGPPHRPGMIRVSEDGAAIEVEVWAVPAEHFGSFVAGIPAPLGIGKIELAGGAWVSGFICEGFAAEKATDITQYGGWRAYLQAAMP
jgi:allophanate hydrolase